MTSLPNLIRLFIALLALQLAHGSSWADEPPQSLLGIPLSFIELPKRQNLGLNSIILVPRNENGGQLVVLNIDRRFLSKEFGQDLFSPEAKGSKDHPFLGNGIEAILQRHQLVLKIHPGVALHLRDGLPSDPSYKTFTSPPRISVGSVLGRAYVSTDAGDVRSKAGHIFIALLGKRGSEERVIKLSDGSTLIIGQPVTEDDFPPKFNPRSE